VAEELLFIFNASIALFVIVDPFAVLPVYLSMSERFDLAQRESIRRKSTIYGACILIFFALSGFGLFKIFGITFSAFQIAGGVLLFSIGFQQLNSTRDRVKKEEEDEGLDKDDISIFPIAMPLLAGPGSISTVILNASTSQTFVRSLGGIIAIFIVMGLAFLILQSAEVIYKALGKTGLNLLTRLMGIILCAIAVQFIIQGISDVCKNF
jgi:multiple antibiotic resistance protein